MQGKRKFLRRGQVLILYAVLVPVFIFALGVGLDLGWYYLNVSRLQNAADAAVVAGAGVFIRGDDEAVFSDYTYAHLIDRVP